MTSYNVNHFFNLILKSLHHSTGWKRKCQLMSEDCEAYPHFEDKETIMWLNSGMRIRIRSNLVIFGPPDPYPTCNNGFIKLFLSWTKYKSESTNSSIKWWVIISNFIPTYLKYKYIFFFISISGWIWRSPIRIRKFFSQLSRILIPGSDSCSVDDLDPVAFALPDPVPFSPDPTCNNGYIKLSSSWTNLLNLNQQIQVSHDLYSVQFLR